jgi:hypothetical protein
VVFLILLRMIKSTPVQEIPIGVPVGRLMGGGAYKTNGNGNGNSLPHRAGETPVDVPGVVTVDVLNRLIKENPVNMSQAIRNWMNSANQQS